MAEDFTDIIKARNQRIRDLEAQLAETRRLYEELIYQVGNKYPGESRHETALRYLRKREMLTSVCEAAQEKRQAAQGGKGEV